MAGCVVKRGRFRIYRLFIDNMAIIRLTEGDLRRAIHNVLSESMLLSEGYSGKYFDSQIVRITNDFMQFKEMVDNGQTQNRAQYYPITISLRPIFGNSGSSVDGCYLEDKNYKIRFFYKCIEPGHVVNASYNPLALYREGGCHIEVYPVSGSVWNDVYTALLHEVTHLVDDLIKNCKNHNAPTYPNRQMKLVGIPECIKMLLYMLWSNTEFNAWQASYKQVMGNMDITEFMLDLLRKCSEINDEEVWDKVRMFVGTHHVMSSIYQKSPSGFKNYFIKTSFKLIKKMIKKYY